MAGFGQQRRIRHRRALLIQQTRPGSPTGTHSSQSPANQPAIRVLVADDHAIVRKGLCALLATEPGIEVVGEAQDGSEAIAQVQTLRPDVVLMDLAMPGMDGLEATRRITASQPGARVLVLTSYSGDEQIFPAIRAGALGYLLKDASPHELVQAIRQIHDGESSLHPTIARRLLSELSPGRGRSPSPRVPSPQRQVADLLTDRETEVLLLVAEGATNRQIAEQLAISEATVRSHMRKILSKLNLTSRTQAALFALRQGLAPLGEPSEPAQE
jgi:NarL family two-component system response regulator LiaR